MARVVVLTGSIELNEKLANLKSSKAKAAVRKASRAALKPVAAAAKTLAPRKSGRLSRSVKVRALTRSRTRIGSRVTTGEKDRQFAGKTFYGGFQEYGWRVGRRTRNSDLGMDPSRWRRRTAAQRAQAKDRDNARRRKPGTEFMARAAKSKRQVALAIYRSETRRWIKELSS